MNRIAAAALGMGLVIGCAHTRPEDMSADAHRRESLEHRRVALDEATRYEPDAVAVGFGEGPGGDRTLVAYNPTQRHLKTAEEHRGHAEAHARAEAALRQSEAEACGAVPVEVRAACPLISPHVARVIETVRGVVLELEPGAPAEAVVARMRCHLEYLRARGFPEEEREDGPLFLSGSTLSLEGNAVEISAANPITAAAIRRDARRLFGH